MAPSSMVRKTTGSAVAILEMTGTAPAAGIVSTGPLGHAFVVVVVGGRVVVGASVVGGSVVVPASCDQLMDLCGR